MSSSAKSNSPGDERGPTGPDVLEPREKLSQQYHEVAHNLSKTSEGASAALQNGIILLIILLEYLRKSAGIELPDSEEDPESLHPDDPFWEVEAGSSGEEANVSGNVDEYLYK